LTIDEGDIVNVEREDGEWWFAINTVSGLSGVVPAAFLKRKVDTTASIMANQASSQTVRYARVMYDFDANHEDELSVRTGDVVSILEVIDADWWRVQNESASGLVPSTFLQEIIPENVGNPFSKGGPGAGSGSGSQDFPDGQTRRNNAFTSKSSNFDDNYTQYEGAGANDFCLSSDAPQKQNFYSQDASLMSEAPNMTIDSDANSTDETFKRNEAIQEFVNTERTYVSDLKVIIDV
jgi:SH3 domain